MKRTDLSAAEEVALDVLCDELKCTVDDIIDIKVEGSEVSFVLREPATFASAPVYIDV